MGLGGGLLWTSVIRTLNESSGQPVRVAYAPLISDLLAGRLYRGDVTLANDPVYRNNPRIEFPPVVNSSPWIRWLDTQVDAAMRRLRLRSIYERLVFALARLRSRRRGQFDVHLDLALHSYVDREQPDRLVWKTGGHIIDIILRNYRLRAVDHRCEMYFSRAEEEEAVGVRQRHGLRDGYVVVEPHSNERWFGDLRAWPFERWQAVVDDIVSREEGPQAVQIGEGGRAALRHAVDLSGKIPFRIAVLLMKHASLFLGLEGGLMHAANAVGVPAVIVWGGVTLPEFAGYPEMHTIVCEYVECSSCGRRGCCPNDKKCLNQIEAERVSGHVRALLAAAAPRQPRLDLAGASGGDS